MNQIKHISKILIANRGEIALRIMRTCREMGIETVAIFSEADRHAPYTQFADHAIALSGNSPSETYLQQDKIIQIALQSGADAIHPGYGFLSENAIFARKVLENGLIFIGPNAHAIEQMGSKSAAKRLMQQHDIPTIKGYQGEDQSPEKLIAEATQIGFPLLLKAAAGGGGRGMRIVQGASELANAIEAAKQEAQNSFGDDELILEQYFPSARHIEFQIFGDQHGNVLHLFERECSIQRRYQKVLEESPSPILSLEVRQKMGETARKIAQILEYDHAGTIEFIYTPQGEYFFLEVNTRLQVEHPVTEMVTGLDLVRWQIQVSEGSPLPLAQHEVQQRGYALECRLYAEDAHNNFMPAVGTVELCQWRDMEGVRYEMGIATGSEVGVFYDAMLAKIVAHADDRRAAFRKMHYALRHLVCLGLTTNQSFLIQLLQDKRVQKGEYDTHFLQHFQAKDDYTPDNIALALAAACLFNRFSISQKNAAFNTLPLAWRNNRYQAQREFFLAKGATYEVKYIDTGDYFSCEILQKNTHLKGKLTQQQLIAEINGERHQFFIVKKENEFFIHHANFPNLQLSQKPLFSLQNNETSENTYRAAMPAQVLSVLVSVGDEVQAGDALLVLSSMKMETTLRAQQTGTVQAVFVQTGENIAKGVVLLEIS